MKGNQRKEVPWCEAFGGDVRQNRGFGEPDGSQYLVDFNLVGESSHVAGGDDKEELDGYCSWEDHSDTDLGTPVGSDQEFQDIVGGLRKKKKKFEEEFRQFIQEIEKRTNKAKKTRANRNDANVKHAAVNRKLGKRKKKAAQNGMEDGGFAENGAAGAETTGAETTNAAQAEGETSQPCAADKEKERKKKAAAAVRRYKSVHIAMGLTEGLPKYVQTGDVHNFGERVYFDGHDRGGFRCFNDSSSSDDENVVAPPPPVENDPRCKGDTDIWYNEEWEIPYFQAGMRFTNYKQFKLAIQKYAVLTVAGIRPIRNESKRQTYECRPGCPWRIHASEDSRANCFRVKKLSWEHNCRQEALNMMATSDYLARTYHQTVWKNPAFTCRAMMLDMFKEKSVGVGFSKCVRAKVQILSVMEGNFIDEYGAVLGYADYLRSVNPNNTVVVVSQRKTRMPGSPRVFMRMYICLDVLKDGFKKGCRKVVGIDGTWLRGICKGVLLVAVAKDGNGQMYPIAWVVVDFESHETWSWFIGLLIKDLDLGNGENMTILSDKHKGIMSAVKQLLPNAEQRFCSRHLFGNLRKFFGDAELQDLYWCIVFAYEEKQFEKFMTQLRAKSRAAHDALLVHDVTTWARAYFNPHTTTEDATNNITESFNGWIKDERALPIISMFEAISDLMMQRRAQLYNDMLKWEKESDICPYPFNRFKKRVQEANHCDVVWDGQQSFRVSDTKYLMVHTVEMIPKTCSCRYWQLTGVPCAHLVRCCLHKGWEPEDFISPYVKKYMYRLAYERPIEVTRGREMWANYSGPKLEPPIFKRRPGRPKKNRIPSTGELRRDKGGRKFAWVSKDGIKMRCSHCQVQGHNMRTCPKLKGRPQMAQPHNNAANAAPCNANTHEAQNPNSNATEPQMAQETNGKNDETQLPAGNATARNATNSEPQLFGTTDAALSEGHTAHHISPIEPIAAATQGAHHSNTTEGDNANNITVESGELLTDNDDVQFQRERVFDRAASQRFRRQLRAHARRLNKQRRKSGSSTAAYNPSSSKKRKTTK